MVWLTRIKKPLVWQARIKKPLVWQARIKKRMVLGLREVLKGVKLKKIKLVVMVPNIEESPGEGPPPSPPQQ